MAATAVACGTPPFAEPDRSGLPVPVLPDHPDWVALYWKAWDIALTRVQSGTTVGLADRYLDEGFSENVYQWDTCFMTLFADYGHGIVPGVESLDSFYNKQREDGYICREISQITGQDVWPDHSGAAINPPLFAWAEWLSYQKRGGTARLAVVLPKLVRYFDWVKANRTWDDGLYWSSGYGSGMDNSPRGGPITATEDSYGLRWVDMTSQQAMAALYIARIADVVGDSATAGRFRAEYHSLKASVNTVMWDPEERLYFDVDASLVHTGVRTIASFWPMVAELADAERCTDLLSVLLSDEFWGEHPFPTLSRADPSFMETGGYWKGGVWAPTNTMVIKGLTQCGFRTTAFAAARRHIEAMVQVMNDTGTIWETYAPDRAAPGDSAHSDFVGWSGVGPIALLIEDIMGISLDAPHRAIDWTIQLDEPHGMKDLTLGEGDTATTVSLVAARRGRPGEPRLLTVEASAPFTLRTSMDGENQEWKIEPGTHVLALE